METLHAILWGVEVNEQDLKEYMNEQSSIILKIVDK